MADKPGKPFSSSVRFYVLAGLLILLALVGGVGGWAANARVSSAVIAQGLVVVESNLKKVQHQEGGIVAEIFIKNGSVVNAGDLLIRLDVTRDKANLALIENQWIEGKAKQSRLKSERDGAEAIVFDAGLLALSGGEIAGNAIDGERKLFNARRATRLGQVAQLRNRTAQFDEQIRGLESQHVAKVAEIKLIDEELEGLVKLLKKGHVAATKVTALRRQRTRLEGEAGQLVAQVAVVKGRISETELQVLQIERDFRENVLKELRDVDAKIAGLQERRIAAKDKLQRMEIRAPDSGFVHKLEVHTVNGVIRAGEPIMLIVPKSDKLVIDARVAPGDVDQVRVDLPAMINFSAFNQRTTPQVRGTVIDVSPDLLQDTQSGLSYYMARLQVDRDDLANLGDLEIVPGMPADVFIRTGERTVLSFLLRPLADQLARTFRED